MKMTTSKAFDLSGKKALITGSSEGIGLAIAKSFLQHGCEVIIHDKDNTARCREVCASLIQKNKKTMDYIVADFENIEAVEKLFADLKDVDILVLNASVQIRQPLLEIARQDFDRHVNTNFWANLRLIQHFLPQMVTKQWGRIISIGSVQEVKPHPQMAVYAALKSAVSNLLINIALQYGKEGITANTISPGVIQTRRNEAALADTNYASQLRKKIPLGTFGQANDCSGIALLLCSAAGQYITGQRIYCDGGMSAL